MPDDHRPWLHGLLELCLLGLLDREPDYGLRLAARLAEAGLGEIPGGTLYPALVRLESTGLIVASRRPSESGPPRKYFALTADGRDALADQRARWRDFSGRIHVLLGEREVTGG